MRVIPAITQLFHTTKADIATSLRTLSGQHALLLGGACSMLMLILGVLLFVMSPEPAFGILVAALLFLALFSIGSLSFVIWNQRLSVANVRQLAHVYRDLPLGLIIMGQDRKIHHVNDILKKWLPLDNQNISHDALASCVLGESQEALVRLNTYTQQREAGSEVLSLHTREKESILCHIDVHICENSPHILWLIKDVTDAHPLEVQAKKTYALYHHLFHTMPYPAAVVRQDGTIEWHNTAFSERFGARHTSPNDTLAAILGADTAAWPKDNGLFDADSVFGSLKIIKSSLHEASDSIAYFILPERLRIMVKEPVVDPFLTLLTSDTPHVTLDYQGGTLAWNDLFGNLYPSVTEGIKITNLLHLPQAQQQEVLDFIHYGDASCKAMMLDDPLHAGALCFVTCKTADSGQAKIKLFFIQLGAKVFEEKVTRASMLREAAQDSYIPSSAQQGASILLIEDDATIRSLCAKELASKGYVVIEASCGAEALRLVTPQLHGVICDILLSDMNGMDLIATIEQTHSSIPALLMSGHIDGRIEDFLAHHPRRQLLRKPFAIDMMFVALDECIAGAAISKAS